MILKTKMYIYGTGIIARAVDICIRETCGYDAANLKGCVVAFATTNAKETEGLKVFSIDELADKVENPYCIIATREK